MMPFWALVVPVLFCALRHVTGTAPYFHPTNLCRKVSWCAQPPSRTNFLATCRCLSVHSSFVFFSQQSQSRLQPNTHLQFFELVLCCPLLPANCCTSIHLACCTSIFTSSFGQTYLMSSSYFTFEYQGMPLWPLDAQITGFTHYCSCWSLSPVIHDWNLSKTWFSHASFFFRVPNCLSVRLLPRVWVAIAESSSSTSMPNACMNKDKRGCALFACCCCHLPPQFSSFRAEPFSTTRTLPRLCRHRTRS